ncbi:unnamed protein product [Effrenium voratum]|nr:unnamed protein product [Effrenium voratum]
MAMELAPQMAVSLGALVGDTLQGFMEMLDPAGAIPEKVFLFIVWDFIQAAVRLLEAGYEATRKLLSNGTFVSEMDSDTQTAENVSNAEPGSHFLTKHFDRLADGLWLFLDIYGRVGKLSDSRQSASAEGFPDPQPLRSFLEHVPDGRTLAALEDVLENIGGKRLKVSKQLAWCNALLDSLTMIKQNVSEALSLAAAVLVEYRGFMRLEQSFDVPSHLAYLELRPNWFPKLLSFIDDMEGQVTFSRISSQCSLSSGPRSPKTSWVDATGYLAWHGESVQALLERIRQEHQLSYTFWSLQSADFQAPSCRPSSEVLYDPSACLEDAGWAGYVYRHSPEQAMARYQPRPWRGHRIEGTVLQVATLKEGLAAPPVPLDVVIVSPLVGNCRELLEMLRAESMTISKLVYVAFNPTLPPPLQAEPNFTFRAEGQMTDEMVREVVFSQCSLATISELLAPLQYRLLQVEHLYAVYVHRAFHGIFPEVGEAEEWRSGWFCSPLSKFLLGLEASKAGAEASLGRAICRGDSCDCRVPYRGPMCDKTAASIDDERPYKAAIHYVVNDAPDHMQELLFSLKNLYDAFNARYDYPVLIFHDGLSQGSRRHIVSAAPNRIWFFDVGDDWLPSSGASHLHSTFGAGYMAQSRFRSGPVFVHPALEKFDYLWSLDSDSHFPTTVEADPFLELHSNSELVMGWSYVTTTSPASVRRLWEYTMLYAMKEKINIWSNTLSKNWKTSKSHFMSAFLAASDVEGLERMPLWNDRVLMTDCEVLRLSFFRSSRYWDYFKYLDSLGGFWTYRWGDHAVRTLGLGLALWEEDRWSWEQGATPGRGSLGWPRVFQLDLPYAHQDFCHCERGCKLIHDPKNGLIAEALRGIRKKFWTC